MSVHFLFPKPSSSEEKKDSDGDIDMLLKSQRENFEKHVVIPGEGITHDTKYMGGHGTYFDHETHFSSVAGVVERVNNLISVRSLHARYTGNIGDLVIGRITEVSNKRWKVDINSRQDAVLLLSAINLPGGVQRRKTEADELQMRKFFIEGDLLAAEVQGTFQDGSSSLHTRNLKYGKLRNGSFLAVPPALIQRSKTHFHTLSCGVDVTLGLNGYVWVGKHSSKPLEEVDPESIYSNENEPIDQATRETIARVCNCINALSRNFMNITDTVINYAYEASLKYPVKEVLKSEAMEFIVNQVKSS
ncbi:11697_t:CDS:2 [Acaulospora morrowiae]|uniref:11697_t:CDS:1 n=1 Tax=Acaulospora morrowiae TaxID=94023 RepID=A0A9N9E3X4_9GLOM|nr:11697_t:CDS:2 [Acaulospora morrowiae]